jgi:hypothetical protein
METVVIVVVVAGLLLSFTRQFSPLRAAQQLGRIGGCMTHEEDLELAERRDVNQNDPPIPHRRLRGR